MREKIREQKSKILAKLEQQASEIYFLKEHMRELCDISDKDVKEQNIFLYDKLVDLLYKIQTLRVDQEWKK